MAAATGFENRYVRKGGVVRIYHLPLWKQVVRLVPDTRLLSEVLRKGKWFESTCFRYMYRGEGMTVALFCGSREWTDPEPIRVCMEKLPEGSIVIHGDQRGADLIADTEARRRGFDVMAVEAAWDRFGARAGPIRNQEMLNRLLAAAGLNQAVRVFAFHHDPWLGRGTKDMVVRCIKHRLRVEVFLSNDSDLTRASGAVVCTECNVQYWRHPSIISVLDSQNRAFLTLSCDGRFLKL